MAAQRGRRPKAYSQADRLARMLRALASRSMTVQDLAEAFEVTKRQVYRDLDRIHEEGHPLEQSDGDGEKTWRLPPGYKGLPPIMVSPYELMALHFAKRHLDYLTGTPFVEDLGSLIKKIEVGLSHRVFNHLARINQVFLPRSVPVRNYVGQKVVLKQLQKALLLQCTVVLQHRRPGYDEPAEHRVDPYVLLLYQFGLYLVGYSHRAQALRMFAVERIVSVEVLEDRFNLPEELKLDQIYENLFGLVDEPAQTVRIQFASDVAYLVKERRWHPSQQNEVQEDGSVIATFSAGGMEELTSWILSWGPAARVLEPQALVESVKAQLTGALGRYRSGHKID
ncbi:MAG: WYL domain-containing protein [Nitrospira sp.]|nr:WYL domain-containing protein [Nitrospira sp.]